MREKKGNRNQQSLERMAERYGFPVGGITCFEWSITGAGFLAAGVRVATGFFVVAAAFFVGAVDRRTIERAALDVGAARAGAAGALSIDSRCARWSAGAMRAASSIMRRVAVSATMRWRTTGSMSRRMCISAAAIVERGAAAAPVAGVATWPIAA